MLFLPRDESGIKERMEKIDTYLLLARIGCPVARSVIIFPEDEIDRMGCKQLQRYFNSAYAVVRYIYIKPNSSPISGGSLHAISADILNSIRVNETLLWLLEPFDRLCNDYGINLLFSNNTCTIEILGKGFDVTDLNRGQLFPHETIYSELPVRWGEYKEWWKFLQFTFVNQHQYDLSVRLRIEKLMRSGISVSRDIFAYSYKPLPFEKLEDLLRYISILHDNITQEEYCVSCCINMSHFVFWDIQTPLGKKIAYGV